MPWLFGTNSASELQIPRLGHKKGFSRNPLSPPIQSGSMCKAIRASQRISATGLFEVGRDETERLRSSRYLIVIERATNGG